MANFAVTPTDTTIVVQVGENTQAAANSANAAAGSATAAAASATLSQAWSEGTLPGGAGTKSAKEWAGEAFDSATAAAASAASLDNVNLWPDLDFSLADGDQTFAIDGFRLNSRLYNNKTWDPAFVGPQSKGAWVYDPGSATLMGFDLYLNGPGFADAGIVAGDVVSFAAEVTAPSGVVRLAVRWFSEARPTGYTWVTSQQGTVSSPTFTGDTNVLKSENITVPVGATGVAIYLEDVTASAFNLTRLWVVKGAAAPSVPPLRIVQSVQDAVIAQATQDTTSRAAYAVSDSFSFSSSTPQLVATSKTIGLRAEEFRGWGDVLGPAGVSFNAIRFTTASHNNPGGGASRLNVVIRAGTTGTAHTTDAPIVAVGFAEISTSENTFNDVLIPLRDPTTGAFKTLTDADLSNEYFIGYWFSAPNGTAIGFCSEMRGTMPNRISPARSYYSTQANPQIGAWMDYTGDGPFALDHVLLADLAPSLAISDAAIADIESRIDMGSGSTVPNIYNAEALRQYAKRVTAGEAITIAFLGDSWTNTLYRLFSPMRARFATAFGISAPGYSSANTDISGTTNLTRVRSGTWTNVRSSTAAIGPDNAHATTTDTSALVTYTPSTSVSQWYIHYLRQPNGGSFTYAVGGGTPVTVDTNGTLGYQIVNVAGSATGELVLDVTVAGAAGVTIAGAEARNTTAGQVLLHKLGSGGARASHYAGMGAGYLEAAYQSLGPDVVVICLGTNDHAANVDLAEFRDQLRTIVNRVRANVPLADILLLGPGPNNSTAALLPVMDYIRQVYELAVELDCAFVNLMSGFGTYSQALERGLFEDAVHPNTAGGLVIARTIWRGMFRE